VESAVMFPAEDLRLEGLLWTPVNYEPRLGAVLCHPHPLRGGDMHSNVIRAVTAALQRHHIATLRFNFRGTGQSTGVHGGGTAEPADVTAAIDYLLARCPVAHLAVIGYSFGAAVGVPTGAADPRVTALVGIALPVQRVDPALLVHCAKATLFVLGDRDTVCPLEAMRELSARCIGLPTLTVLEGADHFFWGREAEIAQAVVQFVTAPLQAAHDAVV
jgi:alpha/beta superfamily hydrolase